ncbi:hypothetical protein [Clostridium sp. ZBS15]|uniref:hypothetical protein n=1 Tax=Clostridium sp. ZBS15 TaxID=2949969 RepID=UPI00207A83EA|nr:hypothetical protein [Clostridium sp. ZBS15]
MENYRGFDIKIIHKVNYITIIVISLLMSLTTMSMLNFKLRINDLLPFIITIIVSIIIFFSNINDFIKAISFSLSIIISNFGYLLFANFNEQTTASDALVFEAGIVCGALYFNKKVLIIDAFVLDICIAILFLFNPRSLLGENFSYSNMLNFFVILNGITILIYCITIWNRKLIEVVDKKFLESRELADKLDAILLNKTSEISTISTISNEINDNAEYEAEKINNIID